MFFNTEEYLERSADFARQRGWLSKIFTADSIDEMLNCELLFNHFFDKPETKENNLVPTFIYVISYLGKAVTHVEHYYIGPIPKTQLSDEEMEEWANNKINEKLVLLKENISKKIHGPDGVTPEEWKKMWEKIGMSLKRTILTFIVWEDKNNLEELYSIYYNPNITCQEATYFFCKTAQN